ncbi:unnamed protein product [Phyllotreta striolata]|uniref:Uncharacterized protein n=1 Tax=Phyllotreta striolata TaxID=444603 RepID=A0A9N9TC13_PHYSR|nr:unnamed protein product [Phyllotreta striolata]
MTTSICKASVYKAYQDVINDVISNTREHFIEEGVDEAILNELKQLWETKLKATKAVDENKEVDKILNNAKPKQDVNPNYVKTAPLTVNQLKMQQYQQQQQQMLLNKQIVGQVPPNNHIPQVQGLPEWRRVPIQLTIPSAPGSGENHRILSVDVPEVFLQDHHLKSILTGQVISTTMGLPLASACAYLQEHVNAAFLDHQKSYFSSANGRNPARHPHQLHDYLLEGKLRAAGRAGEFSYTAGDAPKQKDPDPVLSSSFSSDLEDQILQSRLRGIPQGDGPADSSEEDDKSEDGSEEVEEDKEEDEMEDDFAAQGEDDPLNSGDDVSDADGTEESFETDNVIVCQFDKITRSRNRWKFHLKDGIMNLNGEDFIFQKASGDAEW